MDKQKEEQRKIKEIDDLQQRISEFDKKIDDFNSPEWGEHLTKKRALEVKLYRILNPMNYKKKTPFFFSIPGKK